MAFSPVNSAVLTGVTVTVGQWSQDKGVTINVVVGSAIFAIGLAAINEAAPDLASKFGLLVLVVALFMYGPAIAWKLGMLDKKKYPVAPSWR